MVNGDLGDWTAAVDLLAAAAEGCNNANREDSSRNRSRFNDRAHLLDALVRVEAYTDAEPVIVMVMEQATEVGSQRTTNLLLRVCDRIQRSRASSTLADSAAALRRLLDAA
jgi:hypothetical protein